jgi:processive 1,2-diacylglycerol beta-glucosyltransferase
MIKLYDNETNVVIGTITEAQLRFLLAELEEEDSDDQDYYIDANTLAWLESEHGDQALLSLLREALGHRDGMEIRWVQA